jgi:homoserine dehydrogenase
VQRFFEKTKIKPLSETVSKYYLRIGLLDKPGGLAAVAKIFAEENISVSGCAQKEFNQGVVPVVFITHKATYGQISKVVKKCSALSCVQEKIVLIRIEDLK